MKFLALLYLFGAMLLSPLTYANSEVKFHGTLLAITCVANNDQPVSVSFGRVNIRKIDSLQYVQPIPLTITCDNDYNGNLSITITGTACDFDASAIQSSVSGLGVRIMQNGAPVIINDDFQTNASDIPDLKAVLIAQPDVKLTPGNFTAAASIVVALD